MKMKCNSIVLAMILVWATPGWAEETGPDIQVEEESLQEDFIRYEKKRGLHVGDQVTLFGYGELHYTNPIGTSGDEFDFHRFVIGLGIDFTDWLIFRSEVDFEHAATEIELEIAYLDFLFYDVFNARTGIVLTPVGFLNEHHEPTLFYSVERPQFNTVIIPTTWFGAAAGFHGKTEFGLGYQIYVMESLDALKFTGSKGLRGGRGKTAEALGRDVAGTVRLEYTGVSGLQIGTSFWAGNTGQGNATIDGGLVTIAEGDARFQIEGLEFTFTGAWVHIGDADRINLAILAGDPTFTNFVASDIVGYYGELAYHVFHHLWPTSRFDLVAFGRHERFNTQHKMPSGFASDPANDRNTTTFGVAFYPIEQVALKADYNFNRNDAGTANDQFNAGFAFVY